MIRSSTIKGMIITVVVLIAWNWISSTILFFLSTRHFQSVSPTLYLQTWIHLYAIKSVHSYLFTSGLSSALVLSLIYLLFLKPDIPDIYGKARFAKADDIYEAGLFAAQGILLGKANSKMLRLSGYEHVSVFAPTGTGKTAGITVPNLLDWQESCVVSDIKLELFKLTSKYRESIGHKVYLWSIGSQDGISHCYNPLDSIGNNPYTRIDEIQKIAAIFIPDNPNNTEEVWSPQTRMLFVALTLLVLDTPSIPKTISSVVRLFKSQPDFVVFIKETLATQNNLDPICKENLMKLIELPEKTRSGVTFTFTARFELFDNPLIVAATSRSDFDIRKLRSEKMTIYVGVTNDNLVRLSPLLSVFYQQVADVMTRKVPDQSEPYGVLLLMDEFSSLRRMESFQKNIGLYREYKLRIIIIIQELSQLYDLYGQEGANVFIESKIRIVYTQNNNKTCQLIESILGNKTIIIKQKSKEVGGGLFTSNRQTESIQYASRPLMLAQEIRLMPEKKALIIVQGHSAIYAKKIAWFRDKPFKHRMLGKINIKSLLPEIDELFENNKIIANTQTMEKSKPQSSEQLDDSLNNVI